MDIDPTHRVTLDAAALTDDQRDGAACVACGTGFVIGSRSVPVAMVDGSQVFACVTCVAPCADCGTVQYAYLPNDNDRARFDCPRDHRFPTETPVTPEGAAADAQLRERAARRATWPGGEVASVRTAADNDVDQGDEPGRDVAARLLESINQNADLSAKFTDEGETDLAAAFADISMAWRMVVEALADDGDLAAACDRVFAANDQARTALNAARARRADAQGSRP